MFKNANEVANASDEQILALVGESYNASLDDILDKESNYILKQAWAIKKEAEKIAFAIRDRHTQIVDNLVEASEDEGEEFDEDEEYEKIDEFMNAIAYELDKRYNDEWEHRPDSFWIPSIC